ncbi:MAG: ankyrin repeat domain-containing protein [Terriglobales bacterium]
MNRFLVVIGLAVVMTGTPLLAREAEPVIEIQHTQCNGACPDYDLKLFRDGRVQYQGNAYVPIKGSLSFHVPENKLAPLAKQCSSSWFQSLPKWFSGLVHDPAASVIDTDGPDLVLTCRVSGQSKSVHDDLQTTPEPLRNFQAAIEYLANPMANLGIMTKWVADHPNLNTDEGEEAVAMAARLNAPRVLDLLIGHGARTTPKTFAMESAVEGSCTECISILLKAGIGVDEPINRGERPLIVASGAGNLAMVRQLIEAGADPARESPVSHYPNYHYPRQGQMTPLMAPAFCWDAVPVQDGGGFVEQDLLPAGRAQAQSRRQGCANVVRFLLDQRVDVNQTNDVGATALMLAVDSDSPETVHLLVQAGADVEAKDKQGRNAIDRAEGNPEILKLLQREAPATP